MRTKTESKRQDILEAARLEFSQRGYHETKLDHIAQRLGGSKATIYNYFPTKEALFAEMLAIAARPATAALLKTLQIDAPLEERLHAFARLSVRFQTDDLAIAIQRLLIGDADKLRASTLSFYNDAELNGRKSLVELFQDEQAKGHLRAGNCETMVRHLEALIFGDLVARLLIGEREAFSQAEKDASADGAVQVFLAAFGQ